MTPEQMIDKLACGYARNLARIWPARYATNLALVCGHAPTQSDRDRDARAMFVAGKYKDALYSAIMDGDDDFETCREAYYKQLAKAVNFPAWCSGHGKVPV